jgi:hypothetical protein
MARRLARVLGALGSALVALVLAHSIVYLVRYGSAYGEALAHAGHDTAWTISVIASIGLGAALALGGAVQLQRLAREARTRSGSDSTADGPGLLGRWLTLSARLTITTAVLLTIQENVERAGIGLPAPGIGLLLSADYPWALVTVASVGLAVGLVIALFRWRRDVLIARIRAGRGRIRSVAPAPIPAWVALRRPASVLGRAQGLRAPPLVLAS